MPSRALIGSRCQPVFHSSTAVVISRLKRARFRAAVSSKAEASIASARSGRPASPRAGGAWRSGCRRSISRPADLSPRSLAYSGYSASVQDQWSASRASRSSAAGCRRGGRQQQGGSEEGVRHRRAGGFGGGRAGWYDAPPRPAPSPLRSRPAARDAVGRERDEGLPRPRRRGPRARAGRAGVPPRRGRAVRAAGGQRRRQDHPAERDRRPDGAGQRRRDRRGRERDGPARGRPGPVPGRTHRLRLPDVPPAARLHRDSKTCCWG